MAKTGVELVSSHRERQARGMSCDEAMVAYANGDTRAFEVVYEAVIGELQAFVRRREREPARVEDIIQQTFLQIHAARGAFIPGARVIPWAIRIAERISIDANRRSRREVVRDLSDEDDAHGKRLTSREATGEEVVHAREISQIVAAAYANLSEPQQKAIDLRTQGKSCAETARLLETSSMGVRLRVRRGLQAIYVALAGVKESARPRARNKRGSP